MGPCSYCRLLFRALSPSAMTLAFVVELQGGLANRLRALWSAHAFALRYARLSQWLADHPEFGCDYRLITPDSPLCLITVDPARPWQRLSLRLARWLFSSCASAQLSGGCWGSVGRPTRFAPRWMPFSGSRRAEFESIDFIPAPFLPLRGISNQAASRLAKAWPGGVLVGVHIRRTDHQQAVARSNTNAFIAAMRDQLNREPSTRFCSAPMIRQKLNLCASCSAIACFGIRLSALIAPVSCPQSMLRSTSSPCQAAIQSLLLFVFLQSACSTYGAYHTP